MHFPKLKAGAGLGARLMDEAEGVGEEVAARRDRLPQAAFPLGNGPGPPCAAKSLSPSTQL